MIPFPVAWAAPPTVDAAAYILVNPATGETLAQRAPDRKLPMASTTKIMTALVALDRAGLDDRLTVPPAAEAIGGSTGFLRAGETLTVRDLLTALLVPSGNDAAITLAQGVAGSQAAFVSLMNERAARIGLTATRYANPHGLDAPGHHSTVRDMVRLGIVAMRDPVLRGHRRRAHGAHPGPLRRGHPLLRVGERPARHRSRCGRHQDRHDRRRRLRADGPRPARAPRRSAAGGHHRLAELRGPRPRRRRGCSTGVSRSTRRRPSPTGRPSSGACPWTGAPAWRCRTARRPR